MARPRSIEKQDLPPYLYVNSVGYYSYRDPHTKQARGLGKDRESAIRYASRMNMLAGVGPAYPVIHDDLGFPGTLTSEYILGLAKPVRKTCGIYVLMHGREIVYVGQSLNCNLRIGTHLNEEVKVFDSYFIIECPESRLDEVEAKYIVKFHPKYNIAIPAVANSIEKLFVLIERST